MGEILPGVHQVEGVDPSPDFATHVFLLKDKGPSYTLLDTGLPGVHTAILAYLKSNRIEPTSIRTILLTHLHRDHTGNLRKMVELTHARTFAHWLDAAYIAMRPPYDGPGVPPAEPVEVDEKLKDGDAVDAAGGLVAYHTPGHTPGHTSFYQPERKILFCGDLFYGETTRVSIEALREYDHHFPTVQVSARRMGGLRVDSVLTYHGAPVLKGGGDAIQALIRTL